MTLALIESKFKLLGYQSLPDIYDKFETLVLKLEEENIRRYQILQRANLKAPKADVWYASFHKYCHDLGFEIPKHMCNKPQLTNEGKIFSLNKLLNIALSEEYLDALEEEKIKNESTDDSLKPTVQVPIDESLNQTLNNILTQLSIPTLQDDAAVDEIKSAIELLIRLKNFKPIELESDALLTNLTSILPNTSETSNPMLKEAAAILRSLHSRLGAKFRIFAAQQLSQLSADVVWITERFQQITGNPVTNSKA